MRDCDGPGGVRRIVSLVPSTTETVVAFGAGDRLVGCTRWCTHPESALRDVTRIGGTKNPSREQVMALAPDLVLANAEENRVEDIEWLRERVPVLVQTPCDVPAALAALHELAARLGVGADVAAAIEGAVVGAFAAVVHAEPRLRVYYAIWCKPWMSVGAGTFVHDLLLRAGVDNVAAASSSRYPELAPSAAAANGVDVVLLASEPWSFDEQQRRDLTAAATFGSARLLLCDGRDFCWHGSHMAIGLPRAIALLRELRPAPVRR